MNDFDDQPRRPKTHELEIAVAVARAGSLGGAAAELGCTQSRISHALGELEGVLGFRLFTRSRVGTRPTEAGAVVIAHAKEALDVIDSMARAPEGKVHAAVVRVAAYRSVATHLLTPLASSVAKKHPGIRVEIDDDCGEGDDVQRLVRGGRADLGVVHLPAGEGFSVTPFVQDDYVIVLAAPRERSRKSIWEELAHMPFLELRCSGARAAVTLCRRHGMTNRTAASYSSDSTLLAQVAARRGFSILPRLAVEPLPPGLAMAPLPLTACRSLAVIRRKDRRGPLLRLVTEAMLAEVRRESFAARKWLHVSPSLGPSELRQ